MKTFILSILLICTTLQAQTSLNQISESNQNYNRINSEFALILNGETQPDNFGQSVCNAGDVNGDGYSDIIVGASENNNAVGKAYIYLGGISMDTIADITLTGEGLNNHFGFWVSTAGDVNGDGYSDIIVQAYNFKNNFTGKVYIYFGGLNMDTMADLTITGLSPNENFGWCVSTAGDVNGDGFDDVIVSDNNSNTMYTGKAYLYFGGVAMDSIADVTMTGEVTNSNFGWCVSTAGDVNGDGFDDVIVGARGFSINKGRAYIYFGGVTMDNIADLKITGEQNFGFFGGFFGTSVSSAGDVNGDGYSDVIIGASNYQSNSGRAYIYFGGISMDTIADFKVTGESKNNGFGYSVSSAGDFNNDGYSDVVVGAYAYDTSRGKTYIFSGGMNLDTIADLKIMGETTHSKFGVSVSNSGDINGDGFSDVIIGAQSYNNSTGRAYLISGNTFFIRLNLSIFPEGFYSIDFNQLRRKDFITVFLRNSAPPFQLVDSSNGTIDSLSFSSLFDFPNALIGEYYIVIKHFNSIQTWSKSGGEYFVNDGNVYNYDFTTSISQSYGDNLKLKGSKYCLYSGDVNQDGNIDLSDVVPIYNGAIYFVSGNHLVTDLTADGIVDLTDLTICYNNSTNFVRIRRP